MRCFGSITELIGKTPTVRLFGIEKYFSTCASLYAKLEGFNPSGSVKDRAAFFMLKDAESRGLLREGGRLIEATSGNLGISLSMLSPLFGCKAVIVMPDSAADRRGKIIRAYGGELVLTDGAEGMRGAIREAERLLKEDKSAFSLRQFENPKNLLAHYMTTGREIYKDTDGGVDIFLAGVGTAGTLCGAGKYLKEKKPTVSIIAQEPTESAVLSGGVAAPHLITGIGAGFIPPLYDERLVDGVERVSYGEAREICRILAIHDGVFAGISSAAALFAAVRLAKKEENCGKNILVILPDGGEKYIP